MSGTVEQPRSIARRAMFIVLVECVLGSALVLFAASRPWAYAVAAQGDLRVDLEVTGSAVAAVVPALGLVGLAGALALVAARGWLRQAFGVLIAGAGVGAAIGAAMNSRTGSGDLRDEAGAALGTNAASALASGNTQWPWLAFFGSLAVAVAGVTTAWRGATWPAMSSRYDAPGTVESAQRSTPERTAEGDGALEQWRALDRGEDPTVR